MANKPVYHLNMDGRQVTPGLKDMLNSAPIVPLAEEEGTR